MPKHIMEGIIHFYPSNSKALACPFWLLGPTAAHLYHCYKLVQGFRVPCLFTGQYNTKGYDTMLREKENKQVKEFVSKDYFKSGYH